MKTVNKAELNKYKCVPHGSPDSVWYASREVTEGGLQEIRRFDDSGGRNRVFNDLDNKWKMILEVLDYKTEGKKILELGCGAERGNMESVKYNGEFNPWFGRFAHLTKSKTGLEYIGVDCGDLSGESFPNRELNLLDKESLVREFSKNHFDIAVAFMLFNSPELERIIRGRDAPNASYKSGKRLAESIVPQLEEILKPDGIFLWYGGEASGLSF